MSKDESAELTKQGVQNAQILEGQAGYTLELVATAAALWREIEGT